jgi:hypothetical protein
MEIPSKELPWEIIVDKDCDCIRLAIRSKLSPFEIYQLIRALEKSLFTYWELTRKRIDAELDPEDKR